MISFQKYGLDYFLLKIDYLESLHLLDKSLKPTIVVSQQGFLHTCNFMELLVMVLVTFFLSFLQMKSDRKGILFLLLCLQL